MWCGPGAIRVLDAFHIATPATLSAAASPGRYANLRMAFRVVPMDPADINEPNSVILPAATGPRSPGDGQEGETRR
jgi:hypothetical protein